MQTAPNKTCIQNNDARSWPLQYRIVALHSIIRIITSRYIPRLRSSIHNDLFPADSSQHVPSMLINISLIIEKQHPSTAIFLRHQISLPQDVGLAYGMGEELGCLASVCQPNYLNGTK